MNKKMFLSIVFLVSNLFNTVIALNEEQREVLYILNDLGQSFDSVPMVAENIDMFIGMLQMNMQITEKKLQMAKQEVSEQFWKSAKILGALFGAQILVGGAFNVLRDNYLTKNMCMLLTDNWVCHEMLGLATIAKVFAVLGLYDAFKEKNALEKALAVDKKILRKLKSLKDSLPQQSAEQQV